MIEKCNKIYSIFNEDILVTNNIKFNAIQGYDIVDICNVGGVEDVIVWFRTNNKSPKDIPYYEVYRFINPVKDCEWYINNNFIAYKDHPEYHKNPVIKAFFYGSTAIIDNFDTLFTFKYFLSTCANVKRVGRVGYLSTPHEAIINYTRIDFTKIKLPYIA